jgi:cysteine synthase
MKIANSLTDLIGKTPMVRLDRLAKDVGANANLIAKLEYLNPCGSVKDRIALNMIETAITQGLLTPDTVIIEPTSGNTGIGLAMVANSFGYKLILTMPDSMSKERITMLKALGANVILTPGANGMRGAIEKANALAKEYKHAFIPQQFENPANPEIHVKTTGVEIWNDTDGKVDIFVAGVGTGGTITGVGQYLKQKNPDIKIVAVEPAASPAISKGTSGPHKIQGIGAGFIPKILNVDIIDEIVLVENDDAIDTARALTKTESLLVGISAGAAVYAAIKLSKKAENKDKNIVVVLPDSGLRYVSSGLYDY